MMSVRLEEENSPDFGAVPVKNVGGEIIHLRDIATWRYEESVPTSYYRVNGLNTITMTAEIASSANLLTTAAAVRAKMDELRRGFPGEITASVAYDSSEYVRDELNRIYLRTGLCVLILLLFVLIIYRSWRYMLIILSTLAVNILTALAIYSFAGLQIHIYTLAGITVSLGIIIDTSIVMIDHYSRYRDRKVFPAILSAVATTVGREGQPGGLYLGHRHQPLSLASHLLSLHPLVDGVYSSLASLGRVRLRCCPVGLRFAPYPGKWPPEQHWSRKEKASFAATRREMEQTV